MSGTEGLGRLFDATVGIAPVDLSAAAVTGKRVSMKNTSGLAVLIFKGAASSGTDPEFTFKEATADSGGTSQVMANPPGVYWEKTAATLAGTETWTQVTATYSSGTVTLTSQEGNQGIYLFQILEQDLSAGFDYIEVDSVKAGTVAQLGAVLLLPFDIKDGRYPSNLAALSS